MQTRDTVFIQPADNIWERFLLWSLSAAVCMLIASPAFATSSVMGDVLCNIVDLVYGNLGRGLATLAVIILGVGATLGKTSWGLAITVAVGISIIFNADIVVASLGATASGC